MAVPYGDRPASRLLGRFSPFQRGIEGCAIVGCLWCPYGGVHGGHVGLWTSTKTSTETSTAGIS